MKYSDSCDELFATVHSEFLLNGDKTIFTLIRVVQYRSVAPPVTLTSVTCPEISGWLASTSADVIDLSGPVDFSMTSLMADLVISRSNC